MIFRPSLFQLLAPQHPAPTPFKFPDPSYMGFSECQWVAWGQRSYSYITKILIIPDRYTRSLNSSGGERLKVFASEL